MEHFALILQAHFARCVTWLLTSGTRIVLLLVLAAFLIRLVRLLTGRLNSFLQGITYSLERQKRAQTLSQIVRTVTTAIILVVVTMMILGEVGVNLAPILAAAGIGGLAVGFGAQNLVRDVITGFFILLEDQIRVGDIVKVGDKTGLVEQISLRVLTLRDFDGSVHLIPHSAITTVTNMTKDFSYAVLEIGVSYRQDVDEVVKMLAEVSAELRRDPQFAGDILDDLEVVGIDDFAASQMIVKLRIKTQPSKQWRIAREFRRRFKKTLDARHIENSFPPLTLTREQPKQGTAVAPSTAVDKGKQPEQTE
jgi:small conductance mechanosensitive channel